MDDQSLWLLFIATGLPEVYSFYRTRAACAQVQVQVQEQAEKSA